LDSRSAFPLSLDGHTSLHWDLGFRSAKPAFSGVEGPGVSGISGVSGLFPGVSGVRTATLKPQVQRVSTFDNLSLPYHFIYSDGEVEGQPWQ
jgi:hypothetical protein